MGKSSCVSTKPRPKRRYRLRNWRDYNAALVRRGSLTFWCDEAALAGWRERGRPEGSTPHRRGRPRTYSDAAITCVLTLRAVYHLTLRGAEGLMQSLVALLGASRSLDRTIPVSLPVPDYTTLSRRSRRLDVRLPKRVPRGPIHLVVDATGLKVYGEGEWKVRQHGWTKHRSWLKVHLAVDEASGEIRAIGVSTPAVSDGQMLPDLLAAESAPLSQVTGDGAYDVRACWAAVAARTERPRAVFPIRRQRSAERARRVGQPVAGQRYRARIEQHGNAARPPLERDMHIRMIRRVGRRRWTEETGYHRRSLAETAVWRLKQLFGDRVTARSFEAQATEVFIRAAALNRMTWLGMPESELVPAM